MSGFIKKCFFTAMMFSRCHLSSVNSLKYLPLNNQECKVKPETVNVNSDEPVFFPFIIKTSKCSGSCNNINDSYAKLCVVKNINLKVFNLISRNNETRYVKQH